MSDDKDRENGSLIPSAAGKIAVRSSSLIKRGLNLLDRLEPVEDSSTRPLRLQNAARAEAQRLMDSAEQGDADAQYSLGIAYKVGLGVPQDYMEAGKWYRMAAEHGYAPAQVGLGDAYRDGLGVPQDDSQALRWYRKAAEFFRKVAEQGDAEAQFGLGSMYSEGQGVSQDDAQAARWFCKAAEQGHVASQCNLGGAYLTGRGVPQDDAQAVQWYRRAAEQGNTRAQGFLGKSYRDGRGVPQDFVEAYKWLNLHSGWNEFVFAEERDALAKRMTPEQISEAQQRAREWIEAFDTRQKRHEQ